jgi:hypothetical protein
MGASCKSFQVAVLPDGRAEPDRDAISSNQSGDEPWSDDTDRSTSTPVSVRWMARSTAAGADRRQGPFAQNCGKRRPGGVKRKNATVKRSRPKMRARRSSVPIRPVDKGWQFLSIERCRGRRSVSPLVISLLAGLARRRERRPQQKRSYVSPLMSESSRVGSLGPCRGLRRQELPSMMASIGASTRWRVTATPASTLR